MEESFVPIELKASRWRNIITGWKKVLVVLNKTSIKMIKAQTFNSEKKIKEFSLLDVKITDEHKKCQFFLETNKKKYTIKTENDNDKMYFISKANELTLELQTKTNFSYEKENTRDLIETNDSINISKNFLSQVISNIEIMNKLLHSLNDFEDDIKHSKEKKKYKEELNKLIKICAEVEKVLKHSISKTQNIKSILVNPNNKYEEEQKRYTKVFYLKDFLKKDDDNCTQEDNEKPKEFEKSGDDSIIDQMDSSSNSEQQKIEEIKTSNNIIKESLNKIENFKRSFSFKESEFIDVLYNFRARSELPYKIKPPENFVKGVIKSISNKKVSMPIEYNEPLSMLQKQCEKFFYSPLLTKASSSNIPSELKIVYIAAFICAEISQSMCRFLKPMNPILGETFEFFDNRRKFRFFSEQVSHIPPITAYICESNDFIYYGDTRVKTSFKLLKGAVELEYTNKTHLLFKKSNHSYVFTKPNSIASGFLSGKPKYENKGEIKINDVNDSSIYAEIIFKEDDSNGKKSPHEVNLIEGTVYKENNPIYKIKGNWMDEMYYTDLNDDNKESVWTISSEKFMKNSMEEYYLPDYSVNLNTINDELCDVLPHTDSRMRPDQRLYEIGRIEEAQEMKLEIEKKQKERHDKFDEEKIKYEPIYFNEVFNDKSEDFLYIYKGGYFEERKDHAYSNKEKIFDNEKIKDQDLIAYIKSIK